MNYGGEILISYLHSNNFAKHLRLELNEVRSCFIELRLTILGHFRSLEIQMGYAKCQVNIKTSFSSPVAHKIIINLSAYLTDNEEVKRTVTGYSDFL